jgi:putative transposase
MSTCVSCALGIGIDGTKHPLALVEGSTENTTTVTELLVGLRERGLDDQADHAHPVAV